MASIIRDFNYSKARGRGRGILGLREFNSTVKPGSSSSEKGAAASPGSKTKPQDTDAEVKRPLTKLVVAQYTYKADPNSKGGFKEISLQKGVKDVRYKEHKEGHAGVPTCPIPISSPTELSPGDHILFQTENTNPPLRPSFQSALVTGVEKSNVQIISYTRYGIYEEGIAFRAFKHLHKMVYTSCRYSLMKSVSRARWRAKAGENHYHTLYNNSHYFVTWAKTGTVYLLYDVVDSLLYKEGQLLELVRECPDNEHWWEVKNEDGEQGFAPSSYLTIKDEQGLPWLQAAALKTEEEERKLRVSRLSQQRAALEGKGFGPAPKECSNLPPKPYISSYGRETTSKSSNSESFYCSVCEKQLNGPKPYQAHMASKAHKEELALLEES